MFATHGFGRHDAWLERQRCHELNFLTQREQLGAHQLHGVHAGGVLQVADDPVQGGFRLHTTWFYGFTSVSGWRKDL